jgi:hypothetical protein
MHGTFRGRIDEGAGMTVHFGACSPALAPATGKWRAKLAALLAGCCVAALPIASLPTSWRHTDRPPPVRHKGAAPRPVQVAAGYPPPAFAAGAPAAKAHRSPAPPKEVVIPRAVPVPPSLPEPPAPPAPMALESADAAAPRAIPAFTLAPLPAPPIRVALPEPAPQLAAAEPLVAPPAEVASAPPIPTLRAVDVEQLADSEVRSQRVAQLHEPGLAAGSQPTLAARIAAMQVTPLPPARLRESDRAILLAEAPTRMTVRIGGAALGKVDFRMSEARTVDIKLASLLDILEGQYDAAEFARLRSSPAADAYVSFDQLRALGLKVHYDAVYDELRING